MLLGQPKGFFPVACSQRVCNSYVCEIPIDSAQVKTNEVQETLFPAQQFPSDNSTAGNAQHFLQSGRLVLCPDGHLTHGFLSCDRHSHCKTERYVAHCEVLVNGDSDADTGGRRVLVAMFQCHQFEESIPYTLVCDFRHDCTDGSDEKHCTHSHTNDGSSFRCSSGQLIFSDRVCDLIDDCLDRSDEADCKNHHNVLIKQYYRKSGPVIIFMDGKGNFTDHPMSNTDGRCPETHFPCPNRHVYCLPVFLKCNGFKDCPGGEDEWHCDEPLCLSLYRCRSSTVCLHVSHLCDGWPQCPERDDELLCNATCPSACLCQGLAAVCQRSFSANQYPELRYLDATGSGIVPSILRENLYLVYLSLARCNIETWPGVSLKNLQYLDLTHNELTVFYSKHILLLQKLRSLLLRGNPLTRVVMGADGIHDHNALVDIDLSHTDVQELDMDWLIALPSLQKLNLSFTQISSITTFDLSVLSNLLTVDLRGCNVETFGPGLFRDLQKLSQVYASTYRLCCKDVLPAGFNVENCFADQDNVSSCEDLIASSLKRLLMWIISITCLLDNAAGFVFHLYFHPGKMSGHRAFLLSLASCNCLTGACFVIILAADATFRDNYVWHDGEWRSNSVCKLLAFLSMLSNEVSAFTVVLLHLDRLTALAKACDKIHFGYKSTVMACLLSWALGLLLSAIPLIHSSPYWSLYSQSTICMPLPFGEDRFLSSTYSLGVTGILNLILFLLVAAGQAVLNRYVHSISLTISTPDSTSQEILIARRLTSVIVSTTLLWLLFGVWSTMCLLGVAEVGSASTDMYMFLLLLNATLNPIMYAHRALQEKRSFKRQDKLLRFLKIQAYGHRT